MRLKSLAITQLVRREREKMENLNDYQKLNWISFAIREAINGNNGELMQALELVEDLRDTHEKGKSNV